MQRLSGIETRVLQMLADGATTKEVALELHISDSTVRSHLSNACEKLHHKGRVDQAMLEAARRGYITIQGLHVPVRRPLPPEMRKKVQDFQALLDHISNRIDVPDEEWDWMHRLIDDLKDVGEKQDSKERNSGR